ncbi:MAG: WD40/YVTN/BNR-like repeat-containing protein, partial [Candidatus Promineifilaceae bacterium]
FPQYQAIGKVQVDPAESNTVIVGAKTGLYFSNDAGLTWEGPCVTNNHADQRQDVTGLLVRNDGAFTTLYAAVGTRGFGTPVQPDLDFTGANGVYRATVPESGCPAVEDWDLINVGWPAGTGDGDPLNDQVGRIDLAMAPSNGLVIYAQIGSNLNSEATLGVWRSANGGNTWQQVATPSDYSGCNGMGQTWYNAGLTVDPNDPDTVILSQIDVYRSTDGGETFHNLTCGYGAGNVHVDQHGRAYVGGDSSTLLVGNDGGAWVSHNADTIDPDNVEFISLNDSVATIEFYSGDITANFATSPNPGINGGAQDNGSSVNFWEDGMPDAEMWDVTLGADGVYSRIEPVEEQHWYQETQNGFITVKLNGPYGGGQSATGGWVADRRGFLFPYEIDKYDQCDPRCDHMIAGSYRVWETIQGAIPATSWYINSPDLTKGTLEERSIINQLAYSVSDSTVAIVGTNDGNVQIGFNLGQGVANSGTWVDVTDGNQILPNRPVLDVTSDPAGRLVAYAGMGGFDQNTPDQPGHVFRVTCSEDCASFSWENKSGNLPNIPVDSIIANPLFPQQVFAGTDWGLYFTNDINAAEPEWFRFEAGLPHVMIWDMAIDRGFTTLALFTRGRGAFAWPLPDGPVEVGEAFNVFLPSITK